MFNFSKLNLLLDNKLQRPTVFVSFNDNYIKINLRYITNLWERKKTQSEISSAILDYLHKNKIEVASSSIIVSNKK